MGKSPGNLELWVCTISHRLSNGVFFPVLTEKIKNTLWKKKVQETFTKFDYDLDDKENLNTFQGDRVPDKSH